MNDSPCRLAELLATPQNLAELSLRDWDRVIRHARVAGLLGRLRAAAYDAGLLQGVPENVRNHLDSAWLLAERQDEAARWEVERIHSLLFPRGIPLVVLKGAAYAVEASPVARGRTFSDIDILVPEGAMRDVERALAGDGWMRTHVMPHDRRYYEEWMHEIPPMQHRKRKTTLDIHHAITPPIGRYPVDSRKLLDLAVPVPGWNDLYVLCHEDQILHAAAHLFLEAEFEMAYRDMIDMRLLYQQSPSLEELSVRLHHRAEELGLGVPLQLAENALVTHFDLKLPEKRKRRIVDGLFDQVLRSPHPEHQGLGYQLATVLLYLRGHHLKLPLHLLLPHLLYKGFVAERVEAQDKKAREEPVEKLRQMMARK
jgi:hypothetical protein